MIKIRAFRAIDEPETCERYIEGHSKVLQLFGITSITSAKTSWVDDPTSYAIIAESLEGDKLYGGARIQIAGHKKLLPIEEATGKMDEQIHHVVKAHSAAGTGELCGLWNSREVAGMGIGSIFLGRVGVAVAAQVKLASLFALCAPATVDNCIRMGLQVATTLGNNGLFFYPKENLIATAMILKDVNALTSADAETREYMLDLRQNPVQKRSEKGRRGPIEVEYDLAITSYHFNDPDVILHNCSESMLQAMTLDKLVKKQ